MLIHYGRHNVDQSDIDAVVEVLQSDFLTQGPVVPKFENAVANLCHVQSAIAVCNATAALHIACRALGLGAGDRLWTSATTFVASANCALYCGASVDFVDIDHRTYNMSVDCLREKLRTAEQSGTLPKIVVPVHLCGQSCEMKAIYALSQQYGFKIIEDASHAIGGQYLGEPVGNCKYSDITIFSFHPVKIITTGEGGMALTNNPELADRLRLFRSHGITSAEARMQPRPQAEIWNYQQIELGYNYRMTDIQAALGLSQLDKLSVFIDRRHRIAERYTKEFVGLPLNTPWQHPDARSSYHLYPIRLKLEGTGLTQRQVYDDALAHNIVVNLHYIPVYRHPYFEKLGFSEGYCPESERYYREVLSLPEYPGLTDEQQSLSIQVIKNILS
jgi:UDP-4-amino-4,6-dideoxy-N-acetyl-beta-L-altrosamine transaminase